MQKIDVCVTREITSCKFWIFFQPLSAGQYIDQSHQRKVNNKEGRASLCKHSNIKTNGNFQQKDGHVRQILHF